MSEDLLALLIGLVFVPDQGDFVVKGSQAINRAVDGDLVTWPQAIWRNRSDFATESTKVVIERLTALQEKQYDKSAANLRHGKVSEAEEVAKVPGLNNLTVETLWYHWNLRNNLQNNTQ